MIWILMVLGLCNLALQIAIAKHETIEWEVVEELPSTERGEGGFGHTGV